MVQSSMKSKSFSEILHYLTEQQIFIFNPQNINFKVVIQQLLKVIIKRCIKKNQD